MKSRLLLLSDFYPPTFFVRFLHNSLTLFLSVVNITVFDSIKYIKWNSALSVLCFILQLNIILPSKWLFDIYIDCSQKGLCISFVTFLTSFFICRHNITILWIYRAKIITYYDLCIPKNCVLSYNYSLVFWTYVIFC